MSSELSPRVHVGTVHTLPSGRGSISKTWHVASSAYPSLDTSSFSLFYSNSLANYMYSSSFSRSLFKLYLDRVCFALHPVSDTKVRFFIHARLPTTRVCSLVIFDVHWFSLMICRIELRREKSVTSPIEWNDE
jgi:hypothetical protein